MKPRFQTYELHVNNRNLTWFEFPSFPYQNTKDKQDVIVCRLAKKFYTNLIYMKDRKF